MNLFLAHKFIVGFALDFFATVKHKADWWLRINNNTIYQLELFNIGFGFGLVCFQFCVVIIVFVFIFDIGNMID